MNANLEANHTAPARASRWPDSELRRVVPWIRGLFAAVILQTLLGGCTTEPLISRDGISGAALGELSVEALLAGLSYAARNGESLGDIDPGVWDSLYLGGLIPVKRSARDLNGRADNGTRVSVNGRERGILPLVTTLPKPGPHRVQVEIPVFEPFLLVLGDPIRLNTPQGEIEAWPPVIVDMLTGEVFTTKETSTMDVQRHSGPRSETAISKKLSRNPLLIVTTTNKPHATWRKLGQMRVAGRAPTAGQPSAPNGPDRPLFGE